jgi:hypothetical protein
MCSYDLMTLATVPFPELYSRPQSAQDAIVSQFSEMLTGKFTTTQFKCEPHILKETFLGNNRRFLITPKWITPLIKNGKVAAVSLVINAKEISPKSI